MAFTLNTSSGFSLYWGWGIGAAGWCTAQPDGRSRVRFARVSLEIFIDIILPATVSSQQIYHLSVPHTPGALRARPVSAVTALFLPSLYFPSSCILRREVIKIFYL
jgi:hypothetical protein